MSLPPTVRVKLSSEAAEAISLTPVVVREFAIRDLMEQILGVTGKDEARIGELLLRGTMVSGASRFRWQGWAVDEAALRELLATFPDPDPSRMFAAANCLRAVLRGGRQPIELPRDAASRKGMFQRANFWDALMRVVAAGSSGYAGYSYRERCDRYVRELSHAEAEEIRAAAGSVQYSTVRERILTTGFTQVELFVAR
ncbi:MAG: hypothetical protein JST11_31355 [Acidobacteria bacterium]|nr:hypothetical protein [Acidobacteriota bacterium]